MTWPPMIFIYTFPSPTKSHLPAPSSTPVKVMGIRFALDNCHKENVILFHHPLFSWYRYFSSLSSACLYYMILKCVSSKPCAIESCMWFWELDFAWTSCLYTVSTFLILWLKSELKKMQDNWKLSKWKILANWAGCAKPSWLEKNNCTLRLLR